MNITWRHIIIIKTSSTGSSGKNKIVYKLLLQPHKHQLHGKLKNTTQGTNQRLTSPLNPSNVPVSTQCGEGHSTHESGHTGNTLEIGTLYTLILQTLMDELQRQLGMSNSDRSRWNLLNHLWRNVWPQHTEYTSLAHVIGVKSLVRVTWLSARRRHISARVVSIVKVR